MLAGAALNMAACGGGSDDVENDLGTNIPPTMTADQENRGSITIQRYSSDRNSPFGYSQNGLGAPGVITFDHHQLDDVSAIVNAVYNSGETIQISFDSNL